MKKIYKPFLILLSVILLLAVAAAAVVASPDDSISGWWHLDEGTGSVAADSSGSGNDGTVCGAAWVDDGKFGQALSFSGDESYVQLPPSDQILSGDAFTINAWFKTSYNHPAYGGGEGRLVNIKRNTSGDVSKSAVALYLEKDMIGLLYYTGSKHVWVKYEEFDEENYYYDDEWHYVTVTHDADTYRLYYDGEEVASQEDAFGATGSDNAYLGCYDPGQRCFQGSLDEVGVWNRALSAEEVAALVNPLTEMRRFEVSSAHIEINEDDDDRASISGSLQLNGDGAPVPGDVTVTVGTFTETITMQENDRRLRGWDYQRPRRGGGCIGSMSINWRNGNFLINIDRADLSGLEDPDSVRISVVIGEEYGQTYLDMSENKQWRY